MKLLYKQVLFIALGKYSSGDLKNTIFKENREQLGANDRRYILKVFYQLPMWDLGVGELFHSFFSAIEEVTVLCNSKKCVNCDYSK